MVYVCAITRYCFWYGLICLIIDIYHFHGLVCVGSEPGGATTIDGICHELTHTFTRCIFIVQSCD